MTILIVGSILLITGITALFFPSLTELDVHTSRIIGLSLTIAGSVLNTFFSGAQLSLRRREQQKDRRQSLLDHVIRPLRDKIEKEIQGYAKHLEKFVYASSVINIETGSQAPTCCGFSIIDLSRDDLRDFKKTHKCIWRGFERYIRRAGQLNDQLCDMYRRNGACNTLREEVIRIIVQYNNEIASYWRSDPKRRKELEEKIAPYNWSGHNLFHEYSSSGIVMLYVDQHQDLQVFSIQNPLPPVLYFTLNGGQNPPSALYPEIFQRLYERKSQALRDLLAREDMQIIMDFHEDLKKTRQVVVTLLKQLEKVVDQYRVKYGIQ